MDPLKARSRRKARRYQSPNGTLSATLVQRVRATRPAVLRALRVLRPVLVLAALASACSSATDNKGTAARHDVPDECRAFASIMASCFPDDPSVKNDVAAFDVGGMTATQSEKVRSDCVSGANRLRSICGSTKETK
jgi:hypothetical protein